MPRARRRALLVGTGRYESLPDLPGCGVDLDEIRSVLEHPNIGAYDVTSIYDADLGTMKRSISAFLRAAEPEDLALLYVTGHGLRDTDGEFVFAAPESNPEAPSQTGLTSSFVQAEFEACFAEQRIALLDCCLSGGFAVGFRAVHRSTAKGAEVEGTRDYSPLTARGLYVLSSSGTDESSYAGQRTEDGPEPSVFTRAVCDILREGSAGGDKGGTVTIENLQEALTVRLRDHPQTPTYSAPQASGSMIVADRPHGAVPRQPMTRSRRSASIPRFGPDAGPLTWGRLLPFLADVVAEERESRLPRHGSTTYLPFPATTQLLLGGGDHVRLGEGEAERVRSLCQSVRGRLHVGWPVAIVSAQRDGTRLVGPILTRSVELTELGDGPALTATGPVVPFSGTVRELLEKEHADELLSSWTPSWRAGERGVMTRHTVQLIEELGIRQLDALEPDAVEDEHPVPGPADGVHNVAVILAAEERDYNRNLLSDLATMREKSATIRRTALSALLEPAPVEPMLPPVPLVMPKRANAAQRRVLHSAMTRRLTVATGPPGTGKSQLVVNAVATAVTAGETVLVVSTSKRAVEEVVARLRTQQAGAIVRTGRGQADPERDDLTALLDVTAPFSAADARARLTTATDDDAILRARMAEVIEVEERLRIVIADHAAARRRLDPPDGWQEPRDVDPGHARTLAAAWLLGGWRRRRFLARHDLVGRGADLVTSCRALADLLELGRRRDELMRTREGLPTDDELDTAHGHLTDRVCAESHDALVATTAERARGQSPAVNEFLAAQGGPDKSARKAVLGVGGAWAVTAQSAGGVFWADPEMFDLVILDEAGQMPVVHAVPMLFRARRALVVGDPMQLPPVVTVPGDRVRHLQNRHGIDPVALDDARLDPRHHTTFHAAARVTGGSHLLSDHFRCHPEIAEFANRHFYGGTLNVLTDVDDDPHPAIRWEPVPDASRRDRGSWSSDVERDRIRSLLEDLRRADPDASIGVITPFAAQARALERVVDERNEPSDVLAAGTVHRFQGGERDVIVLSLVTPSPWLERDLRLWNVAITRARRRLIVVGDPRSWRGRPGIGAKLLTAGAPVRADRDDSADGHLRRLLLHEDPGVRIGEPRRGRTADAVLRSGEAVLVDHGPEGADPASHLESMLRLRELLASDDGLLARRVPLCDLWSTL